MSWTKRQFVEQAFEEIGMASYAYDLSPEQLQGALRSMDAMLGSWNAQGIRIGYPIPTSPENSDLDDETNVPDSANEAIYLNLAIRIAPKYGKSVQQETKISANRDYKTLLSISALPPQMQLPDTLPLGAGTKYWRVTQDPFVTESDDLDAGRDGTLDFI